jgi:hypothetical protein
MLTTQRYSIGTNRRLEPRNATVVHPLGAGYLAKVARNSGFTAQKAK